MKITLGGIRGTSPVTRSDYQQFGGDTTAILMEAAGGAQVIVDAGTAVTALGHHLEYRGEATGILMLLTHYHLDHLMGLPSFPPLYRKKWTIEIVAPIREGVPASQAVRRILDKPFWPIQLDQLHARIHFTDLPEPSSMAPFRHPGIEVRWCAVHHPDGCTAYRIDELATGAAVVVATDVEWALSTPAERMALIELCRGPRPADLLLFDGQYEPHEYPQFKGWGHSTWRDAVDVAREAHVGRLLVIHHSPHHEDRRLAEIERRLQAEWPAAALARAGAVIELARGAP